jgi:hypothetical protein
MTEAEFESEMKIFSDEVLFASDVFYLDNELNEVAKNDYRLLEALNLDAFFWHTHRESMQTTLFITLGRIFDRSKNTHSVHRIVRAVIGNPGLFEKSSILDRKRKLGVREEIVQAFAPSIWTFDASEVTTVKSLLDEADEKFKVYDQIRNKFYAHRSIAGPSVLYELFELTNKNELEEILKLLKLFDQAVQNLYWNGAKPDLSLTAASHLGDEARRSIKSVMSKIASPNHLPIDEA